MSSTISAVSSQPSPIELHKRQDLARVLGQLVDVGRRLEAARVRSAFVTGARIFADGPQPDAAAHRALRRTTERVLLEDAARDAEQEELGASPGTTASQPSRSMTSTIWLFAVGWNFTRISPTTPTRGFVPSPTSGSVSKSSTMRRTVFLNSPRFKPRAAAPCTRPSSGRTGGSRCPARPRTDACGTAPSSAGRRRRWRTRPAGAWSASP